MTSLLCKQCLDGVQAALPALPKDSLWSIPCFSEAEALLSGAPNHNGEQDSTVRHYQQQRRYRKGREVGHRTCRLRDHLQETRRYQITSLGRFCCRLDGAARRYSVARTRVLGDAL